MGCGKSRNNVNHEMRISIPQVITSPTPAIPQYVLLTSTEESAMGKETIAFAYTNGTTNTLLDVPVKLTSGSYTRFKHVVYCKAPSDTVDGIMKGVFMIRVGGNQGISNDCTTVIPASKIESAYSMHPSIRYLIPSLNDKVHSDGLYVGQEIIKYCGGAMMLDTLISKLIETTAGKTHRITQHMSIQYRGEGIEPYDIILRDDLEKVAFLLSTIRSERDLIHLGKSIYCPYLRKSSKTSPRKSNRLDVDDYRSQLRRLSTSANSMTPPSLVINKEDTESWTAGIRSQTSDSMLE